MPKVSKWKRFAVLLVKMLGWVLVVFFINLAIVFIDIWTAGYPISVIFPHDEFIHRINQAAAILALAALTFVAWFVFPRIRRLLREAVQIRLGREPTQVLKEAKHAPVLFLRSFKFRQHYIVRPDLAGAVCRSEHLRCRHRSSIWYR